MDDGSWSLSAGELTSARSRPEAFGQKAMVASAHPGAAAIGTGILARGGNAFDAALAVAAAEGVLLPMMCGLGGDAFVVVHDARRGETVAYNGSGVAPAGATQASFADKGFTKMPLDGVHAVSVPGAVGVYEAIHKRHCTLPWAELWAPAIALAEQGVAITEYVSHRIAEQHDRLVQHPYSARQFLPGGKAPAPGDRWIAPDLARSLRAVAQGGAEVFYRGELAERLLAFLNAEGALFEADDFAQQQPVMHEPIGTDYRGLRVCVTAPPSQGFLLLEQLNIIEDFDPSTLGAFSGERIHLLVEAKKLAFADRNRYAGDPDFVNWPLETLISKAHANRRRAEIDPTHARWPDGARVAEHGGDTSYFAVADGDGNAVSFIHSLSASFGSAVVAGDTGITLNNRAGRGFSLDPTHPNVIAPGRRTMHTLNAFMVFRDGKPWLLGGTPGGDQQTQWSTQIISSIVDYGRGVQEAVDLPRWYSFPGTDPANLGFDPTVRAEHGIGELAYQTLRGYGHQVEIQPAWAGGGAFQLIMLDHENGVLRGGSDSRPGGVAIGF
ncbi:MAG: gamma-glutamyltranspeptidase/glutathione hydrolase [Gammaproteobacteria bacterium]|jgi:gamma-glutamyltranspeptidase/glutathione hydrolase